MAAIEGQQIVIVCGRNERRKQELDKVFAQAPHVHVLGYVDNVAALMACADMLVTKAGGLHRLQNHAVRITIPNAHHNLMYIVRSCVLA
ncbi:glycosyltransferase [Paenibacillus arenosi]|uniref:Glycosyl transferase family 28 C-terminal domain-containing protein n=1 Tax=Paenibacillus arenosi TaxID=2774142 RepID=A0ABR9B2C9_9BACL|nr:glycosyltransferase [Paenibacillus arenosi]MBD8500138.1 hypothetical protein [Paenibacillus arenosi]